MLVKAGLAVDEDALLAGSVSPDAGVPNAARNGYEPPKRVTHWHNAEGEIDAEAYAARYLRTAPAGTTAHAFHIGYYLHLLADDLWTRTVWRPRKQTPLYQKALANADIYMHEIKSDWYGLDFLYLKAHHECVFYRRFRFIDLVPDYLDYLPPGLLTDTIKKIQAFYRLPQFDLQRPYVYLSQAEIEAYVEVASDKLTSVCRANGWLP
jgi:hypothetical protein